MNRWDETFNCMGCAARVRLESASHSQDELEHAAVAARALLDYVEATLTRFDPHSELSALNRDPRAAVPAPRLVREFVLAARHAGERSGGLVDATLLEAVERAGYATSRSGIAPASLHEALAVAPRRRPAQPHRDRTYARLAIGQGGRVLRPVGVRLDSGGIGKGLAVDTAAARIPAGIRYAISVGGDLAVGGVPGWEVAVLGAFDGNEVERLRVPAGGVATSGIGNRIWQTPDGGFAHHLLDPSTGAPAWTGLVAVTAVAATTLEAEVLAKDALLSGPRAARWLVSRLGGVLQHDDGRVQVVPPAPVARLKVTA